jgi:glycosyltransferase involved in cell wall biosynthesis
MGRSFPPPRLPSGRLSQLFNSPLLDLKPVLHLIPSIAPAHGGSTTAVLGMVRALRDQGTDARIVSTDDDVGQRMNVTLGRWVEHEGLPVWFIPRIPVRQHTLVGFTYAPEFGPWLQRHLGDYSFLHLHTVFSYPSSVAARQAFRRQLPYAVSLLGQLCDWSLGQRSLVKRLHLSLVGRRNLNHAAFLHSTSPMETRDAQALGISSPVREIPLGVPLPKLYPGARKQIESELGLPPGRTLAIFLSRIHEKKGIEMLLQSMAQLRGPELDLIVAGDGHPAYVQSLQDLARSLGVEDRVHWVGHVEGDRKWSLLAGSDFFVLPSYSENFGIVVIEALASGLPVVISDAVGLADSVRAANLGLVTPPDPKALTEALKAACLQTSDREKTAQRARQYVAAHHSWETVASQLMEAYEASQTLPSRS